MMNDRIRKLASWAVWQLCRILPIQENKVVFMSFGGKGFGDNPKAIALELLKKEENLDLVWITRNPDIYLPQGIRPVLFGTPQAVKELSTARIWVDNSRGGARYKKPGQYYLQTWHGFALKKIERGAEKNLPASYVEQCKKDSGFIDLLVSNSDFMTRIYREDFWYDGEIALYGSPRNDLFFKEHSALKQELHEFFQLPEDRKLVLYAPTFRDDGSMEGYQLDIKAVLDACARRFGGEWSGLIRLHPNAAEQSGNLFHYDGIRILDATAYPDMQQLLACTDLLITDYSSAMFDYALQNKPCVQLALDLESYRSNRDFYLDLEQLPFPMALSNDELIEKILEYDPSKQEKLWETFKRSNGITEDGNASRRCARWILAHMKG